MHAQQDYFDIFIAKHSYCDTVYLEVCASNWNFESLENKIRVKYSIFSESVRVTVEIADERVNNDKTHECRLGGA